MKKIAVVLCVLFTLTFASCGMNDIKNNVEQGVEDTKDMANDAKQGVENMVKEPMETAKEFTSNENKNVDRTNFITEEMAKRNGQYQVKIQTQTAHTCVTKI